MGFLIETVSLDGKNFKLADQRLSNSNTYTILLGKNGSGKSRILKKLSTVFAISDQLFREQPERWKNLKDNFSKFDRLDFSYSVDGSYIDVYTPSIELASSFNFKYGSISGLDYRCYFPSSLICVSTSPFDRFPEQKKSPLNREESGEHCEFPSIYTYIGLKQGGKCTSTHSLLTTVINSVLSCKLSGEFHKKISSIFKIISFLGYGNRIRLSFKFENNFLKYKKGEDFEFEKYIDNGLAFNIEEKYSAALKSLRVVFRQAFYKGDNKVKNSFSLNISNDSSSEYFDAISTLISYEYLTVSDFKLSSKEDNRKFIRFSDASSGEQCVALMLMGIFGSISDNSLVLIDEPEISLHPEWQYKFIELLNSICAEYFGCHFIIATHSPQIVTALRMDDAMVLNMDRNELVRTTEFENQSIDYQLITSFDSAGIGNEYLNRICIKTLSLLSSGKFNSEVIKNIVFLKSIKEKVRKDEHVSFLINLIMDASQKLGGENGAN